MIYHVTAATVTNLGRFNVVSKTPSECSEQEIEQFTDLLAEGGEVAKEGAADRVRKAKSLGFAYDGSDLIGISALKHPAQSYRTSVERNAGVPLPETDFPYEIGWLYVKPEYRNPGTGNMLRYLLIQPALGIQGGCFATTRKQNVMPQRLLTRFGFEQKGHIWTSPTTGNQISLFTRDGSKGALTSVTASADLTEIEAIYISSALASAIDSDRISKLAVRVPALARVAVAACDAGYAEAGTDLMCAIAAEDGLLAAHALNFLHTELESDLKKHDPDFKIIGDIVPSEAVGIPSEEMPEPTHNIGMLFKLATQLPDARADLPSVQLGVEPSLPHVCLEQLEGLGCPHINHVHKAIEAPKASLADAKETLTRIDMDLRAKLAGADEVETDRIQRILINLETLMAELFQSGIALASEYVPFGDAIHKASGIRVVGIKPKDGKPGVWELIVHYNDGSSLKSIASNKRSLGLCLGMVKVGTKVNFQGTLGRTTADGMSLEDGRTVKLLEKVPQNAPVAEEATAGQLDSLGGTPVSAKSVADFRKDLIAQLAEHVSVDPTYGDIYLASKHSRTNPYVRRLALTLGVTPDKGALHIDVYVRQSTRGGWSPDAANTGHIGMYAPPAGTPEYTTFVSELASAITSYISTDIRDAAGLKSFASNYSSPQVPVADEATAATEATALDHSRLGKLCGELNKWSKSFGVVHTMPDATHLQPMNMEDSGPMGEDAIHRWASRVRKSIHSLPSGSGAIVRVDRLGDGSHALLITFDDELEPGTPTGYGLPRKMPGMRYEAGAEASAQAPEATASSDQEATAGNQVDFYDLYRQLNEHYADSNHVLFSYEKRIGTTYYVPFITADYSTADDPKKRPVTQEECLKLKHEINDLLEGSGVKVDAIDRPEVLSKHKWALIPRAADGARTPKLPKEAARAANTRALLDESRALNEAEDATASFFEQISNLATAAGNGSVNIADLRAKIERIASLSRNASRMRKDYIQAHFNGDAEKFDNESEEAAFLKRCNVDSLILPNVSSFSQLHNIRRMLETYKEHGAVGSYTPSFSYPMPDSERAYNFVVAYRDAYKQCVELTASVLQELLPIADLFAGSSRQTEATASTASDRLYAKIAEKVQSAKPGLKSASATVTEIAGTIIIVIQDVVLQPEALSVILNKPIKDKSKSFIRASGVEFDVERFPGKSGKAGDVSIKFDRARPKQVADALGTLKRLFDTAVSYGKSPAPLEATAAGGDLKSQAIGEISTSLSRLAERARNMYEALNVVASQEDKTGALVELPMKLQYEIAKSYEALSGVEALVFRQLEQNKAVIEISYKSLSDADAKEVASKFVPLYKDHKMIGFRGALFAVANSFGKEGTRQVGDVKKLASALRPACDLIEAAVAKSSTAAEVTASAADDLATVEFPQTLLGMKRGEPRIYRTEKKVSYYYGSRDDADYRQLNIAAQPKSSFSDDLILEIKLFGRSLNYTAHYDRQVPRCLGAAEVDFGKTVEETTHNIEEAARKLLDESAGNLGPSDPKPMKSPFWAKDHKHMLNPLR